MSTLSNASNAASAVRFGLNPTPLGAAGLGIGLASSMLGGKTGGGRTPNVPGYSNGEYTINDKPFDMANNLQIQGDNGNYDLVPTLSDLKQPATPPGIPDMGRMGGMGGYQDGQLVPQNISPEQTFYDKTIKSFGNDQSAIDQLKSKFPTITPGMFGGQAGQSFAQARPYQTRSILPIGGPVTQDQIMGIPLNKLSSYARDNNRPAFTPTQKVATALSGLRPGYTRPEGVIYR